MSSVHIHVGQCGNQLGKEFWLKASAAAGSDVNAKRAFHTPGGPGRDEGGHLRAVFVDSEKKVLQRLVKRGKQKKRSQRADLDIGYGNIVSCAKGCGSNWSMGHNRMPEEVIFSPWPTNVYSYSHEFDYGNERCILKTTMEAVRREVEACDCFSGFIQWHSLAGGTGSGFGARLSAELRDRYPVAYQMNVTVAPHFTGETPTQPYNELLCLAGLQQDSDAVIIFENDEILQTLSSKGLSSVSLEAMNSYIAECMLNILIPVSSLTPPNGVTVGIEPWELVRSVAPMSPLKLLHCRMISENRDPRPASARSESWESLSNKVCQQTRTRFLQTKARTGIDDSTLATVCVCRNVTAPTKRFPNREFDIAKMASKIKNAYNCVTWNPFPVDIWTDEKGVSGASQRNSAKSLTVCSNLTSLGVVHCAAVLKSAKLKYKAKAYLHWYERYGTRDSDFEHAFRIVEDIVAEYEKSAML